MVPTAPTVDPTTPAVVPSGPAAISTTPTEQGNRGPPIEFTSPPSDISEFLDAFHDSEEVRFRRLDNIIGNAGATGLASQLLDDPELLLVSVEEPATFVVAEREANWRRVMLEEMKAIEDNGTWELVDPPVGYMPIGLKWVYKVKRDEHGAIVKYKAQLIACGFV